MHVVWDTHRLLLNHVISLRKENPDIALMLSLFFNDA